MIRFGEHPIDAELYRHLIDTADELTRRTGAGFCDWDRTIEVHQLDDAEGERAALGKAPWRGTISLREDVLTTLREMWQSPPREWSREDRDRQLIAVLTIPHELAHLLVPAGERYANGRAVYREFPGRALEEGFTELAARQHADAFSGAEARSPGVTDPHNARSYPQFVPAARTILRYVSELRGENQNAILNALVRENVPGKFRRLSQMILEATGIWENIPSVERDAACAPIINAVWGTFQANNEWAGAKPRDRPTKAPEARSRIMGLQLIAATERARLQVLHRYSPERLTTPWRIAAAQYERRLAGVALRFAQSSKEPDVRAAAEVWKQRADQRLKDAWPETQSEQAPQGPDRGDLSVSRAPRPAEPSAAQPELAVVPSLVEPPRPAPPRRPQRFGFHRRPGPPDLGRDR